MRYEVELEGRAVGVDVERTDGGWRMRTDDGEWVDVPGRFFQKGELRLTTGGVERTVGVHVDGDWVSLQADSHALSAKVVDPRQARASLAGAAGQGAVLTPMPGVVVRIPATVGQEVKVGAVLVVVEAMKMENEFKAPIDGVVVSIDVEVGQALEANTALVTVEAPE